MWGHREIMSFFFQYARVKHPPMDEYDCGVFHSQPQYGGNSTL